MRARTFATIAALLAAGCEEEGLGHVRAIIAVEPATLDVGEVLIGTSVTKQVLVENQGDTAMTLCFADATDASCGEGTRMLPEGPSPFTAAFEGRTPGKVWRVPAGSALPILITYAPAIEGRNTATIVLASDAHNEQRTLVPLAGSATGPNVELTARDLDFGELTLGQRKVLELGMMNHASFVQGFSARVKSDSTSMDFGLEQGGASGSIDARDVAAIRVWYSPTGEGAHTGTLELRWCADCVAQVSLRGRGSKPAVEVDPGIIDFGQLDEGQAASRSFTVRNSGSAGLLVSSIALEQGASTEFTVAAPASLPALLAPGAALNVTAAYLGTSPGRDEARVVVNTNAWDDPGTSASESIAYLTLRATSLGPDIEPLPARVSFGPVPVGDAPRRALLLANAGNAPLVLQNVSLAAGAPALRLEGMPSFPATIQPGASMALTVIYNPMTAGPIAGTIRVDSLDRDEPRLDIGVEGVGSVPNACVLQGGRNAVTFGLVPRGRTVKLPVILENAGGQPCNLTNVRLSRVNGPITIDAASSSSLVLPPGGRRRIEVSYAPAQYGSHSATLELDTNDPTAPHLTVTIGGASAPSTLVVVPPAVDFGTVPEGCGGAQKTVTLYNTGANAVTLSSAALDPTSSADLGLAPSPLPVTIPAGGSTTLILTYHASASGDSTGVLFLGHSDAPVPVAVPLTGRGSSNPQVADSFVQQARSADVLFVVDNSCSMMEEQSGLGANLQAFISFAQQQGVDYRIAVTTTDVDMGARGAFVGATRVITPATPLRDQAFMSNVSQGIMGATVEQGLEAAYRALSDPMINTVNAGFLRPDAMLSVIFISDEEDQSSRPRGFYGSFLKNVKGGDPSMVTAGAVVGTTYPECNSPNGIGDYGPRYIDTVNALGGVVESICSTNWGPALVNIGQNSFGIRRVFPLSSAPVANTIEVRINNVPAVANSWTYDPQANAVRFTAAPGLGATIVVRYTAACLR